MGRDAVLGVTYRHTLCVGGAANCRSDSTIAFQYQQKIRWD